MQTQTSQATQQQWRMLKLELKQDRLLYGYVFVSSLVLLALAYTVHRNSPIEYDLFIYLRALAQVCYISFIAWSGGFYVYLLYHRTANPLRVYIRTLVTFLQPVSKVTSFALLIMALNLTFSGYSYLKAHIPALKTFQYDLAFYELDKWLHFGASPWEITHALLPNAYLTSFINLSYHSWFLFMWGMILFFVVRRDLLILRSQFLLSFMVSWLLIGGVAATLLSSAGPCFMHLLNPEHNFYLPLMEKLRYQDQQLSDIGFIPIWALDVQNALWQRYTSLEGGIGAGISAMPSMHVTVSVLMALASYQLNRKLGYIMWGYMVIILIGSVHLAWHYAVDGYVSIILTILVWKACGYISQHFTVESLH